MLVSAGARPLHNSDCGVTMSPIPHHAHAWSDCTEELRSGLFHDHHHLRYTIQFFSSL